MNNEAFERAKSAYGTGAYDDATMEFIFPQLRESEDERIRKEIIEVLRFVPSSMWKQAKTNYERCFAYLEKQKERKHYWKPTEIDVALFNKAVTTNKTLTPTERAQLDIIRSKFGCCRATTCNGIVQKEQKPVDFPTTDEEVKEFLETHPKVEVPEKYKTPDFVFSKQEYESHPIISKDTTSVKPAEWSEDIIQRAIKEVGLTQHQIDWFKTNVFPPKQEWSEEDEDMYARVVRRYTDYEGVIMRTKEESVAAKMLDAMAQEEIWLKSLRPQPHWKPSEEQMKALLKVVDKARELHYSSNSGYDEYDVLRSLYKQLKELM